MDFIPVDSPIYAADKVENTSARTGTSKKYLKPLLEVVLIKVLVNIEQILRFHLLECFQINGN